MNFLKHAATTLGEIGIVLVAFQAVILAFGGHVPPWPTAEGVAAMVSAAIATHESKDDARVCADYNSRYVRAALVLRQMPNDPAAQLQYAEFNNSIDMIPNCRKAMIP